MSEHLNFLSKPWDRDIFFHLQLDCVHIWVWWGGWGEIGREGGRERERREKGGNEERKEEGRGKEEKMKAEE